MFRVIYPFSDLTDYIAVKDGRIYHRYEVGDEFPRKGQPMPSEARIYELSTGFNALGRPLIESTLQIPDAAVKDADAPQMTQDLISEAPSTSDEQITAESTKTLKNDSGASESVPVKKTPKKSPDRKKRTGGK